MKKHILLIASALLLAASTAFAFDPSLVTKDGLGAKGEAEIGQYGMKDEMPVGTLQLYGAGATYGMKNLGTKLSLTAGGAVFNVKEGFGDQDYQDSAPYLSLGVSQQVYELFGVKLGVFADGTYISRLNDTYEGFRVGVAGMTLVRTGAIAQYEVVKDLNVYGGINGQWLNASVHAEGEKLGVSNTEKIAGFAGAKYDFGPYSIDLNVAQADRFHAAANISYNF